MAAPENVFTTLRGLFLKQGRIVKNWKERKFELKGMDLWYYDPDSNTEKGQLTLVPSLSTVGVPTDGKKYPTPFPLEIVVPGRRFLLCSKSAEERTELQKAVMERTFDLSPKALFTAAREGDANRISLCAKHGVDLNIHDPLSNDETPLHMAAARNHKAAVAALIQGGAQVDSRNKIDVTPLHAAAVMGHVEIVEQLLLAGADANAQKNDKRTPLHLAAQLGHIRCVEVLLKVGADFTAVDSKMVTPLHLTSYAGHLLCVEALLHAGADPNASDNHSSTPLHYAALEGHAACVTALLRQHARPDIAMDEGATPLDLAKSEGHGDVVAILEKLSLGK